MYFKSLVLRELMHPFKGGCSNRGVNFTLANFQVEKKIPASGNAEKMIWLSREETDINLISTPMAVKVEKGAFLVMSSLSYKSEMERKNVYLKKKNSLNHTVL